MDTVDALFGECDVDKNEILSPAEIKSCAFIPAHLRLKKMVCM